MTLTDKRSFTELLDDVQNVSTDESDDLLKVYRYKDDPIRGACLITWFNNKMIRFQIWHGYFKVKVNKDLDFNITDSSLSFYKFQQLTKQNCKI